MGIIKRALLGLIFIGMGANSISANANEKPLAEANEYSAYIFGNYRAQSGNNNGAIAIGGDLDIRGYSIATVASIALPEYTLLVEGDAKFRNGRLYNGKLRVQGDASGISSSVISGLPNGTTVENQALDYSIRDKKEKFVALSAQIAQFEVNGDVTMQWGGLYFKGDGESALQVFTVVADDLKKAHSISVEGIPADATVIVNVVDITMQKLQIVNKSFDAFKPYRSKTLFNFINADRILLNGVSFEASILAPTAEIEGRNGNVIGHVIADEWDGQMHFEGVQFDGKWVDDEKPLNVQITSPQTLATIGYSPVSVNGIIEGTVAELTLNGVPVAFDGETFEAPVELVEGFNTIIARATSEGGEQLTDSISLSLDLTPPQVTIDSHEEFQVVYSDKITVTGLVNDIVRGTVEDEQAAVEVNGVVANVSNRSYAAKDVTLTEGENLLTIIAVDQAGNSTSINLTIYYKVPLARKVSLVSGQDQTGIIATTLTDRFVVKVTNAQSEPVANESVVFRVIQGAGVVGAEGDNYGRAVVAVTDAQGLAQTAFQLGYRTGVANHKVRAKVVGYENEVIFHASAESVIGNKISINSGNNQRGIVGQTLPAPFVVAVTDAGANVVKGARVRFDTISGEGLFHNDQASFETTTDSDGRALAEFKLGALTGLDMQRIQATLIDAPDGQTLTAGFMATAFEAADPGDTTIVGAVLDNQDQPIVGVTVRVVGTDRTAQSDFEGRFKIEQVPVGPVHLIADGSTAQSVGEYPSLSYHMVTVSGVDNPLSAPIYMVKLDVENAVYAGIDDATLTLPSFPGFKLEIAKDSITFPDGSRDGLVSATAVNASKVPMAPPNGMQPQFIVTIQPVGATFDPPAKLTLPNVDGHAPGAQVEMYSFDHDLEEFVAIGLGTVSEDGSVVSSNPGVGVVKAGWHCGSQPGGSGTAHNCPTCYKCENDDCVPDPGQASNERPADQQTPGDCQTKLCQGSRDENGDKPTTQDTPNDCKAWGCEAGSPKLLPDDTDITADDAKCSTCEDGDKVKDPSKEDQKCGDGTAKECYTCKDGKCGNHCDASGASTKVAYNLPAGFDKLMEGTLKALNKIPQVAANYSGVGSSGYIVEGEHCCTDCSKGAGPKPYTQVGGEVAGKVLVTVAFAGVGMNYGPKWWGPVKVGGRFVLAPLAGEVSAGFSAKGESQKMSECKEASCTEISMAVGGNVALGSIGDVSGKAEYCPSGNPQDCEFEIAELKARAEATANLAFEAKANNFLGESCPAGGFEGKIGKVTLLARAFASVSFGGIYSWEGEIKQEVVLYEG